MLTGFVAINNGSTGNRCSHNLNTMPGEESIMNFVKSAISHKIMQLSVFVQIFTYIHAAQRRRGE